MKKKLRTKNPVFNTIKQVLPYLVMFLGIIGIAKVGVDTKLNTTNTLNLSTMADNDYNVSADQLSELYVVASLSNSFDLASVEAVSGNYVMVTAMREISQTTADKIEKPSIIDTNISRGVTVYTVKAGETMASIAAERGLTTDQIRWSNGLKTTDLAVGQSINLPSVAGIVYRVKAGETVASLAKKYGSSAEAIRTYNDLEFNEPAEGSFIVLPGGVLPLVERPEYVAPVVVPTYTYYGSTSTRQNITRVYENVWSDPGNRMVAGQCTWYAWWWRAHSPLSPRKLPDGLMGNANVWDVNLAAAGYTVNRTPAVGAVFQTRAGWYGHVGVVIAVNPDGSIRVREMNYAGARVITEATIPANAVGNFKYIH